MTAKSNEPDLTWVWLTLIALGVLFFYVPLWSFIIIILLTMILATLLISVW